MVLMLKKKLAKISFFVLNLIQTLKKKLAWKMIVISRFKVVPLKTPWFIGVEDLG